MSTGYQLMFDSRFCSVALHFKLIHYGWWKHIKQQVFLKLAILCLFVYDLVLLIGDHQTLEEPFSGCSLIHVRASHHCQVYEKQEVRTRGVKARSQ